MALLDDLRALPDTTVAKACDADGFHVWRVVAPLLDVQVRDDDPAAVQALIDSHDERVRQAAETAVETNDRLLDPAVRQGIADRNELAAKLRDARAVFRSNYQGWSTMTAAQKDTANRQAQRAVANLIGYVLGELDAGV